MAQQPSYVPDFDLIQAPRHLALIALGRLSAPGEVIVDPTNRAVLFPVRTGTAATWEVEDTTAYAWHQLLVVPKRTRRRPPGRYWFGQGTAARIDAHELRCVLSI